VDEALKDAKSDTEVIDRLFTRVVGREPTSAEREKAVQTLSENKEKKDATQDILWALLTSREFYFNH